MASLVAEGCSFGGIEITPIKGYDHDRGYVMSNKTFIGRILPDGHLSLPEDAAGSI